MKSLNTFSSTDSYSTFNSSERLCGAELCRVWGEAPHGRAVSRVVEAAGRRVVLWGTAHCLWSRIHGIGGRVHVALLLYEAILFMGQGLCWREKETQPRFRWFFKTGEPKFFWWAKFNLMAGQLWLVGLTVGNCGLEIKSYAAFNGLWICGRN